MSTSRRALLLPGRAYPATMPLLHFTGLALAQHGWSPCAVSWELPPGLTDLPDLNRWVADRAAVAVAVEPPADRLLYAARVRPLIRRRRERGFAPIWQGGGAKAGRRPVESPTTPPDRMRKPA